MKIIVYRNMTAFNLIDIIYVCFFFVIIWSLDFCVFLYVFVCVRMREFVYVRVYFFLKIPFPKAIYYRKYYPSFLRYASYFLMPQDLTDSSTIIHCYRNHHYLQSIDCFNPIEDLKAEEAVSLLRDYLLSVTLRSSCIAMSVRSLMLSD